MISALMALSTLLSFGCTFYYLKLGHELYQIGDNNRFQIFFAVIAFSWAILKNSMPINESMTYNAIFAHEVFKVLIPLMFMVLAIQFSRKLHQYESFALDGVKYHGIERRHNT